MALCPCGSGFDLTSCCGPIIENATPAPTAEALMRSRYTAFVRGNLDHIERTYAKAARANLDRPGVRDMFGAVEWMGLTILETRLGGEMDETGMVDFAARFRRDGEDLVHRERSNFRREDGAWVYVDGETDPIIARGRSGKVGRNQPCPCGSGKKYKKCCGAG